MKRLMMVVGAAALATLLTGCGGESDGWYAFQGGYVNLRNVKTITTHANLTAWKNGDSGSSQDTPLNGAITRASIEQAKAKLRKDFGNDLSRVQGSAYIAFDGQQVSLPSVYDFKSYKDVLRLLDTWLEAVESLELPTK